VEDIEKNIENSRQELRAKMQEERELNRVFEETSRKSRITQAEAQELFQKALDEGKNPPLQGSYKPGQWYKNIEKIM